MRRHCRSLIEIIRANIKTDIPFLGAEIGVWRGHTSEILLNEFPTLYLFLIDLWELVVDQQAAMSSADDADAFAEARSEAMRRTQPHRNRTLVLQLESSSAAKEVEDDCLAFVFIDGGHQYEQVKADLEAWAPKVREGCILSGHDYDGVGDRRKGWGVKRAVDEFAEREGLTISTEPGHVWWGIKA